MLTPNMWIKKNTDEGSKKIARNIDIYFRVHTTK